MAERGTALARIVAAARQPAFDRLDVLQTDLRTGRRYLRLPVPDPQALAKLADALGRLLGRAGKG